MREYAIVGPAPLSEPFALPGETRYTERSYAECRAYMGQLRRVFGPPLDGMALAIKSFLIPRNGSQRAVVLYYDSGNRLHCAYVAVVCQHTPKFWDAMAQLEIRVRETIGSD